MSESCKAQGQVPINLAAQHSMTLATFASGTDSCRNAMPECQADFDPNRSIWAEQGRRIDSRQTLHNSRSALLHSIGPCLAERHQQISGLGSQSEEEGATNALREHKASHYHLT